MNTDELNPLDWYRCTYLCPEAATDTKVVPIPLKLVTVKPNDIPPNAKEANET
ncbi:hypothetical protein N9B37_01345 [bacterium]|nr:hypothetical protein [bacterium]